MRTTSWVAALLVGLLAVGGAWSAEVNVLPGVNMLSNAVTAAADGDTLILQTGTYSGAVVVDKSLTIRANTNDAEAMVSGSFTIAGAGKSVVVQGLDFSTNINVDQAADVKLLQNTLYNSADIDVTDYKTSEGDGALAVIGNYLTQGGNISDIYSNDAYIAGNTLDIGQIKALVPVWIIGNAVVGPDNVAPVYVSVVGAVQVIGNRITTNGTASHQGISVVASYALIAGNIIKVGHSYYRTDYVVYGIYSSDATNALVVNNIVKGYLATNSLNTDSTGIQASGRILGNIVIDLTSNYFVAIRGRGSNEVKNNLCYNNSNNACGSSAVTTNPLFEGDFQLTAGSPAINAGPAEFAFADLDRTRNDMGAYGGPWSIGQYDAQRDPLNYTPYVFPLFKANSAYTDGAIEVRALGVARLR